MSTTIQRFIVRPPEDNPVQEKKCRGCNQVKPFTEFDNKPDCKFGKDANCKACRRIIYLKRRDAKKNGTFVPFQPKKVTIEERRLKHQTYIDANKEFWDQYSKQYRQANKERLQQQKRSKLLQTKLEGLKAYGGVCNCCGEATLEFLTLDHINGRANEPTRITGVKAWHRLKMLGWPKDNYQILCFNCNCAKGIYGECPHTKECV